MNKIHLDNSHIPLHYQVADYLVDMLKRGDLLPEDRVPPEQELTQVFGVSRTTVRRSLQHLLGRGLVIRKQGKGTFWTLAARGVRREKLSGINRQIFNINEKTSVGVLTKTLETGPEEARRFLVVSSEDKLVVFRRVRHAGGEPMSYTVNYMTARYGGEIDPRHLRKMTMLETIESTLKVRLGTIEHEVEVARATAEIAGHLRISVLDPVLAIKTSVFDSAGVPVEIVWTSFVENRYKFRVVLEQDDTKSDVKKLK